MVVVGTYNVYFDPTLFFERFDVICTMLSKCDVVCFQEIPGAALSICLRMLRHYGFLHSHWAPCMDNDAYWFLNETERARLHGNLVVAKEPFMSASTHAFVESGQARNFVHVQASDGTHIVSTHLESRHENQSKRDAQQRQIIAHLLKNKLMSNGAASALVVLGDFNCTSTRTLMDNIFREHVGGVSWFGRRFNMTSKNISCRFDRVYTNCQSCAVRRVGSEPLLDLNGIYASDHDGFIVTLSRSPDSRAHEATVEK